MILERFKFSVIGNILRAGITLFTSIFLANALGPSEFGRLSFLIASFLAIAQILDLGTSNALITFLSKDKNLKSHYRIYFLWLFIQLFFGIFVLSFLVPDKILQFIWQGNGKLSIILGFIAILFQQNVWNSLARICEANKETKKLQIANVSIALLHLSILLLAYYYGSLTVELILLFISIEILIIGYFLLNRINYLIIPGNYTIKDFISDYKRYCYPLVPFTIISVICVFADSWLITEYAGYEQQAFFGIAMQLSVISLIAARSIINIAWNEFSELSHKKDLAKLGKLYNDSIFYLYSGSLFISALLIPWSKEITIFFLGSEYVNSFLIFAIFLLYPVDQTRGQITGTLLLSLEDTKATSVLGILGGLTNLLFAYILVGPGLGPIPEFNLGAIGIAVKLVILQFIFTNISTLYISRKYGITLKMYFLTLMPLSIMTTILLKELLTIFLPIEFAVILYFFIFCLIYRYLLLFFKPELTDLRKIFRL